MNDQKLGTVARYLHRVVQRPHEAEPSDGQLLRRFIDGRDESAFAILVERHGAMVMGVGRRLLRDRHDVEDVFQATFLVLVRKANSIRKHNSLSSWLHGVAWRTAIKLRRKMSVLRSLGQFSEHEFPVDGDREAIWRELRPVLDEEIGLLPEKYRGPIVLCYLEGKTNEQAARELGCTKGTVSGRLARARNILRRRLIRRGVTLTPALLAALLCEKTTIAAVPAPLLVEVTNLGCQSLGGCLEVAANATKSINLAEGVIQTMWLNKAKMIFGFVLATIAASTGVGVWSFSSAASQPAGDVGTVDGLVAETPMTDQELLQGTWVVVAAKIDGKPAPALVGSLKYNIHENGINISRAGKSEEGVFTLNTGVFPKQIDIHLATNRTPGRGIYKIQEDTLEVCMEEKPTKRPISFRSDQGSQFAHVVLERVEQKKGKKKRDRRAQIRRLQDENVQLRRELDQTRAQLENALAALNRFKDRVAVEKARAQAEKERAMVELLKQREIADKQRADYLRYQELLKFFRQQKDLEERLKKQKAAAQDNLKKARQSEQQAREDTVRARSVNNLRKIGLAFHAYHDVYNRLPAAAIYDRNGRPLLSWRVAVLPYLGQEKLYDEFKLDQPWDSPHNKKLLSKMPNVYAPVRGKAEGFGTYYQVVTGPKTMFDGSRGIHFSRVHDGTSNTLLAAEARQAVPWTKPADLSYKGNVAIPKLGGGLFKGFHVLRADGSTTYITNADPVQLRRFITIDDGQQLDFERLQNQK